MQTTPPLLSLALPLFAALPQDGAPAPALARDSVGPFTWRALGPAVMGGRIVDLEVLPERQSTMYVATASGGLWKSTNRGTTWSPIFDGQGTLSIGDIAVAPADRNVVWVGTGEANNSRSSYWGDGVYKSVDAGKTWKNMGLRDSHHVGRIVIDPKDPDVVFVAALGHLYTPNTERGVFVTRDGGKSWKHALDLGDRVGAVDLALDPRDPKTVYAAAYERLRRPWHFEGSGEGSGIYKTTDGGESWRRLEGGLPRGKLGRIGVAVFDQDPAIVYATIENENPAGDTTREYGATPGPDAEDEAEGAVPSEEHAPGGRRLELPAVAPIGGEIYRSDDAGETWTKTNQRPVGGSPGYYYGQIRIDPQDSQRVYVLSVPLHVSQDGGKTFHANGAPNIHVDHHALWIDPADPTHLVLGNDGGLHFSYDRGETWDFTNNLPIGQFYTVNVDTRSPFWVYGGTQDNGTWAGPVETRSTRGIVNKDWVHVNGGDGFYVAADPLDPDIVYSEIQFGGLSRFDLRTSVRKSIKPVAPRGEPAYRFNWSSPLLVSPHNPRIIWFGGNFLFRSLDRGDRWEKAGGDLTTADPEKLRGNVPHCTITTIAESPRRPGLLWVGTDDGNVQVSRNGGVAWTNLRGRFPGVPDGRWVSRVEASHFDEDAAFVSFTGYRDDDFAPYLFATTDGGKTFRSISAGLPQWPVNVVRQDPVRKELLWVGTERTVHVSMDGGAHWSELGHGLPNVPVHDLVVHPSEPWVAIGTHGRGIYVTGIATLRQMNDATMRASAHVFAPPTVVLARRVSTMADGYSGHASWRAPNPPQSLELDYRLADDVDEPAVLEILDAAGKVLRKLTGTKTAGLHRLAWDLRATPAATRPATRRGPGRETGGDGTRPGGRRGAEAAGAMVAPGSYRVRLTAGGKTSTASFEVKPDPRGD